MSEPASPWIPAAIWCVPFALWLAAVGGSTVIFGGMASERTSSARSWSSMIDEVRTHPDDDRQNLLSPWTENLTAMRRKAAEAWAGLAGSLVLLGGIAVAYRKLVAPAWRAGWRGWVLSVVATALLGAAAVLVLASALHGVIPG